MGDGRFGDGYWEAATGRHNAYCRPNNTHSTDEPYFDVFAPSAKADAEDILIRLTAVNRGPEAARLHLLPVLWFRNAWSWGAQDEEAWPDPLS
jgi:hypothetical protein